MIFHPHGPDDLFRVVVVFLFFNGEADAVSVLVEIVGILSGSLIWCPSLHGYAPSRCLFQRDDFFCSSR